MFKSLSPFCDRCGFLLFFLRTSLLAACITREEAAARHKEHEDLWEGDGGGFMVCDNIGSVSGDQNWGGGAG